MLLRGPSERVLISRFVERKSRKLDCSYPFYTAFVIGFTRERFVALGLPS